MYAPLGHLSGFIISSKLLKLIMILNDRKCFGYLDCTSCTSTSGKSCLRKETRSEALVPGFIRDAKTNAFFGAISSEVKFVEFPTTLVLFRLFLFLRSRTTRDHVSGSLAVSIAFSSGVLLLFGLLQFVFTSFDSFGLPVTTPDSPAL